MCRSGYWLQHAKRERSSQQHVLLPDLVLGEKLMIDVRGMSGDCAQNRRGNGRTIFGIESLILKMC